MDGRSEPDGLADFWNELSGDGCEMRHIQQMLTRIKSERAEATARAARVFFNGKAEKPLTFLALADHLRELRCQGLLLELAIIGAFNEHKIDCYGEALIHQANEFSRGIERFERAFNAELQLAGREALDEE